MNTKIEIMRDVTQSVCIDAEEIVREGCHGDFSLVRSKQFGLELVYQNGNLLCDIHAEHPGEVSLRLHSRVAMKIIGELVKRLDDAQKEQEQVAE